MTAKSKAEWTTARSSDQQPILDITYNSGILTRYYKVVPFSPQQQASQGSELQALPAEASTDKLLPADEAPGPTTEALTRCS